MNHSIPLIASLLVMAGPIAHGGPAPDFRDSTEVSTIAFGSCFDPREKHHEIFDGILSHQPEVFIFLGDNIYGINDGYSFHDFTSSGMSHTSKGWAHAVNSFRVGEATWQMNAGLIEIDWNRMVVTLSAIGTKGGKLISHQLDLGKLEFP